MFEDERRAASVRVAKQMMEEMNATRCSLEVRPPNWESFYNINNYRWAEPTEESPFRLYELATEEGVMILCARMPDGVSAHQVTRPSGRVERERRDWVSEQLVCLAEKWYSEDTKVP